MRTAKQLELFNTPEYKLTKTFEELVRRMNRRPFVREKGKSYLVIRTRQNYTGAFYPDFEILSNAMLEGNEDYRSVFAWVELPDNLSISHNWVGIWEAKIRESLRVKVIVNRLNRVIAISSIDDLQFSFLPEDGSDLKVLDMSNHVDPYGFIIMGGFVYGSLENKLRGESINRLWNDWIEKETKKNVK